MEEDGVGINNCVLCQRNFDQFDLVKDSISNHEIVSNSICEHWFCVECLKDEDQVSEHQFQCFLCNKTFSPLFIIDDD
jgi:hypothetical protein